MVSLDQPFKLENDDNLIRHTQKVGKAGERESNIFSDNAVEIRFGMNTLTQSQASKHLIRLAEEMD